MESVAAEVALERAKRVQPGSRGDLRSFVSACMGVDVPDRSICGCHDTPMDYLWRSFNCDYGEEASGDCIVWANRGGGKTELAAIATLLDCVFKPGCRSLILGGSFEQSKLMYEYFVKFLGGGFGEEAGRIGAERCDFFNGSRVEVLTQSARNVRGRHVHKLRCDEVELFDAEILSAARFVTNSSDSIKASMEMMSTMHRPYGLMQEQVEKAEAGAGAAVIKWCVWEVIEKCVGRSCSQCPLWSDCGGKAKEAAGYYKIDDCITQMRRSSRCRGRARCFARSLAWRMRCLRISTRGCM
jgi:hypothetical protein